MKILSYILIALVAIVPSFWIKDYNITTPTWWTVVLAHLIGRLLGYVEGVKKKKEDSDDE